MTRLRVVVARVLTFIVAVILWTWVATKFAIQLIGASTVADDYTQLIERLPGALMWLFSTPAWVPAALATILSGFLIWLSLPQRLAFLGHPDNSPSLPALTVSDRTETLGSFGEIEIYSEVKNPGDNHGGQQQFFRVEIPFTFNRDVASCTVGLNAICAYLHDGQYSGKRQHSWRLYEAKQFLAKEKIRIPVAFIAFDPAHHGWYGDFKGFSLSEYSDHIIDITVIEGKRSEKERVLIHIPSRQVGGSLVTSQIQQGNRFVVRKGGQELINTAALENATENSRRASFGGFGGFGG